jgi:hypothetical protein
MKKDKMFILEKVENGCVTLTFVHVTDEELKDAYITHEFVRHSVRQIPVFKDKN